MSRAAQHVQVADGFDVVHTFDPVAAMAALERVLAFDPEAVNAMAWDAQLAAVRALYADLGAFYRETNVPPQSDPIYVDLFRLWYAPHYVLTVGRSGAQSIDPDDAAWDRVNGIGPSMASSDDGGEIRKRMDDMFRLLGRVPTTEHILIRMELDESGRTIETCVTGREGSGVCDFGPGTLYVGCQQIGSRAEGCAPYSWNTLAWSDDPWPSGFRKILAPLRWFADFALDVAHAIKARRDRFVSGPVLATIGASARYVVLKNAWTVEAFGLANIAALQRAASAIPANIAAVQHQTALDTSNSMLQAGALFAAAASAAGPGGAAVGAIAGVVIAVAALIARFLPYAVGSETDVFGRIMPLFLVATIPDAPASDPERTVVERQVADIGEPPRPETTYTVLPTEPAPPPAAPPGTVYTIVPDGGPPSDGGPPTESAPEASIFSSPATILVVAGVALALAKGI